MLFNSFLFLIFFPVVVIAYYLLPAHMRPYWLLLASCYFYMSFVPAYILILFTLITLDFFLAQVIAGSRGHAKRVSLWLSVAANVGMLFFFKYFNFFNVNVSALAHALHWNYSYSLLAFALPLGLSFHVFQSLSYVIEVYRGKFEPERNYLMYALYVMFFPQLVAGPIERPQHLLPQFRKQHSWDEARIIRGLERMAWGFFKKLVIADNIAIIVTNVYAHQSHDGPVLILTAILFAYQLYCDFSGYSDIAVGTALVLGYDITENFNRPYAATSIADFWRRWHISLSSWFRDYFFTPLAFTLSKPLGRIGLYTALFVTFVVIGLWHGAAWTYIALGVTHGVYMVSGEITKKWREKLALVTGFTKIPRLRRAWQQLITFILVAISWIFFRSPSISVAFSFIGHLGSNLKELFSVHYLHDTLLSSTTLGVGRPTMLFIGFAIVALELGQYAQAKTGSAYFWQNYKPLARLVFQYGVIISIVALGYFGAQPFIYFQF